MIVIILYNCPQTLRGDLTKWMFEVSTNVFVGRMSSRVRDELWERVKYECKTGGATMVYGMNNEQHFDFRIHNSEWEPVEFDGLKFMLRPNSDNRSESNVVVNYHSKASRFQIAKHFSNSISKSSVSEIYATIHIETTGLSSSDDDIISLNAVIVEDGMVKNTFSELLYTNIILSSKLIESTGITNEDLMKNGKNPKNVLIEFINFIGDRKIVSYNSCFDFDFISSLCNKFDLKIPENCRIDLIQISKEHLYNMKSHTLTNLINYFEIDVSLNSDKSTSDCHIIAKIYEKLKMIIN
ncbi:MAG: type I-E CRISPR-associated endoribonuclease Cas2e [Candidatus Cloacimonetes bacterium]|nr:type I-E CRISPR-associated endoribonuclease Cas2e [Candidatus Cloacimonadota bacterium]